MHYACLWLAVFSLTNFDVGREARTDIFYSVSISGVYMYRAEVYTRAPRPPHDTACVLFLECSGYENVEVVTRAGGYPRRQ